MMRFNTFYATVIEEERGKPWLIPFDHITTDDGKNIIEFVDSSTSRPNRGSDSLRRVWNALGMNRERYAWASRYLKKALLENLKSSWANGNVITSEVFPYDSHLRRLENLSTKGLVRQTQPQRRFARSRRDSENFTDTQWYSDLADQDEYFKSKKFHDLYFDALIDADDEANNQKSPKPLIDFLSKHHFALNRKIQTIMRGRDFDGPPKHNFFKLAEQIAEQWGHYVAVGENYRERWADNPLLTTLWGDTKPLPLKAKLNKAEKIVLDRFDHTKNTTGNKSGDVIVEFPDDFYWIKLRTGACREEGKTAGHCGNVPSVKPGDRILSLRERHPKDKSRDFVHLTFIVNNGVIVEAKGRKNQKPKKIYHRKIVDMLKADKSIVSVKPQRYNRAIDFHLDDLSKTLKSELNLARPEFGLGDN